MLLVLPLVACSSGSPGPSPRATSWDGTLIVGVPGPVEKWDPAWTSFARSSENKFQLWDRLLELATTTEVNGVLTIVGTTPSMQPRLVESIDVSPDEANLLPMNQLDWLHVMTDAPPGKTVYRLHLRQGVTFPSGDPFTSADVKWTYDYIFSIHRPGGQTFYADFNSASDMQVIDKYTLELTTNGPSSLGLNAFEQQEIYDSQLMMKHATASDPWGANWLAAGNPNGAGKFVLDKIVGDDVYLKRNPTYYGMVDGLVHVYPKEIIFKSIPDSTERAQLLARGDIDVAEGLAPQDITFLHTQQGVKVLNVPTKGWFALNMIVGQAPFVSKYAREAVCYAIPYTDILSSVFQGTARRADGYLPVDNPFHIASPYNLDLNRAKALLAEAGLAHGFTFSLGISQADPFMQPAAILIQNQLAKIGVTVHIIQLDAAAYAQAERHDAMPLLLDRDAWLLDAEYQLWYAYGPLGTSGNFSNFSGPAEQRVLQIAETAPAADQATQQALYAEAQGILADQAPDCTIAHPAFTVATRSNVEGMLVTNSDNIPYWNVRVVP